MSEVKEAGVTQRVEISAGQRITYTQEWDVENKLVAVTNTVAGQVTRFYRDADGNLVKKSDAAGTLMIVNGIFEHIPATDQSTSYYVFGNQRIAMRVAGAVYWLHGDHLGSASLTTSITGAKVAELRYLPFGDTRWAWGTTPTDRRYTGQRELAGVGLYDYNARMYWPAAGRFLSADTVVPGPGNPQAFNRYAYVRNSPVNRVDPDGHKDCPIISCLSPAYFLRQVKESLSALITNLIQTPPARQTHPRPAGSDITEWTLDRMREAMSSSAIQSIRSDWQNGNLYAAMQGWIGHVRTTGAWDYKTVLADLTGMYLDENARTLQFAGQEVSFQAIANMTYGYYGASVGIFPGLLRAGAGYFQTRDNMESGWGPLGQVEGTMLVATPDGLIYVPIVKMYYFDDPHDRWWIDFGMALYEKYSDPQQLTAAVLAEFYVEYSHLNGVPPIPKG